MNEAYSGLPVAEITPREAYNAIVDNNVELVSIENLPGTHRGKLSYPISARGIPMLLSGENFGDKKQSASKLFTLAAIPGPPFPLDLNTKLKGLKLLTVFTTLCA